jgi:hypothetical protein
MLQPKGAFTMKAAGMRLRVVNDEFNAGTWTEKAAVQTSIYH